MPYSSKKEEAALDAGQDLQLSSKHAPAGSIYCLNRKRSKIDGKTSIK
jgi:hypothetical protein